MSDPAVAFIVRNEFQFLQIERLWQAYPSSHVLLLGRSVDWSEFLKLRSLQDKARFKVLTYREAVALDGQYAVIFFQTPFPLIEDINKSRLVSVQYGLAKERHNYGEWRSLADMNLMFGRYSAAAVSHFSPSFAVGNLRFAGWKIDANADERAQLLRELRLDPRKPTVLYMPTYRDLGSFKRLKGALGDLVDRYNVVIKAHHNQESGGDLSWREEARNSGLTHLFGAASDQRKLLLAADVVISDFSGAIFDALYARVPVVLYQEGASDVVGVQKFNLDSIEYRRRDELGVACDDALQLPDSIVRALNLTDQQRRERESIREELLLDGTARDLITLTKTRVEDLVKGTVPPLTAPQRYVRDVVKLARSLEREVVHLKRTDGWRFPRSTILTDIVRRIKTAIGRY
jgi:hypothetical protein